VDAPTAALAGLVVGLLAGALAALGLRALLRRRASAAGRSAPAGGAAALREPGPPRPELPPGVSDVLAVVGGPAVVLDVADEVVRASRAAHATGLVRGASLAHPELLALVRAVRREGGVRERRLELPRGPLGGSGRAVLDVRVARLDPAHVLLMASDRTESARLEEVRRDFVVNVSHELKTPVGALSLLAEAVEGAADDPVAVRRFASRMGVETARLTRLVRDIVDLSQLQASDPVSRPVLVDLVRCVEEALDRCQLTAVARGVGVELVTEVPDDGADVEVYGDREQLTTAVANLVDNAVRYSEPGTRVAVGIHRGDGLLEVTVKDQGIGIPPAEQRRVFERFYRVDPARSRATGGTGLGLSIVKHVMSQHGGDVHLWSQVGLGSTFTLRLPDRAARSAPPVPAGPGGPPDAAREGARAEARGRARDGSEDGSRDGAREGVEVGR
jgi:two-component system sensor histidine kinase SenX3